MTAGLWPLAAGSVAMLSWSGWLAWSARADSSALLDAVGTGRRPGPVLRVLVRLGGRLPGIAWVRGRLERAGLPSRPGLAVLLVAAVAVLARLGVDLVLGSLFAWVALAAVPFGAWLLLDSAERRRSARLVDQLPDLTTALAGAAGAGLSLRSSLQVAAQDLPDPLGREVRQVLQMIVVGHGADHVLAELADRIRSREMTLILTTVSLQTRTGGDLVRTLKLLGEALESRRNVRREVRSLTASARTTSSLIAGLSIAVLVMFDLVHPGAVETTTDHPLGRIAMVLGLAMIGLGLFAVARATREPA